MTPIAHGFRTAARRPALVGAEFVWRAVVLAAVAVLCFATLALFGQGLRVSESDEMALRSGFGLLILDALIRIFREAYPQLVRASLVLVPALVVLWIFAAALGRAAVLRPLLPQPGKRWLRPLLGLGLVRVALGLAALAAFYGSGLLAWELARTSDGDVLPGVFFRVLPALAVLVWMAWWLLGWFLWLASIPAVAGRDTFGAIAAAARLWGAHKLHFLRAGLLFSAIRLLAFAAVLFLLAALVVQATPEARTAVALVLFLVLALYMLAAAWLRVARLAAFTALYVGATAAHEDLSPAGANQSSPARSAG